MAEAQLRHRPQRKGSSLRMSQQSSDTQGPVSAEPLRREGRHQEVLPEDGVASKKACIQPSSLHPQPC